MLPLENSSWDPTKVGNLTEHHLFFWWECCHDCRMWVLIADLGIRFSISWKAKDGNFIPSCFVCLDKPSRCDSLANSDSNKNTHTKKKQVPEEAFFSFKMFLFCMVCFLYVFFTQYEYLGKIWCLLLTIVYRSYYFDLRLRIRMCKAVRGSKVFQQILKFAQNGLTWCWKLLKHVNIPCEIPSMWTHVIYTPEYQKLPFLKRVTFFQTIILGIHVSFRECKGIPNRHSTESFQMIFTCFSVKTPCKPSISPTVVFSEIPEASFVWFLTKFLRCHEIYEMSDPFPDFGPQGVKIFRKILDHSTDPMNQGLPFWIKRYLTIVVLPNTRIADLRVDWKYTSLLKRLMSFIFELCICHLPTREIHLGSLRTSCGMRWLCC